MPSEDTSTVALKAAAGTGVWFTLTGVVHFRPRERGFLYVLAPGAGGNATTTMLTAQGSGQLETNAVGADADFGFPFGTAKFKLDENPGAEDFTVIYSPTPLLKPAFLTEKAGRKLTPAEVGELEELRAKHKAAGAPAQEVKEDGGAKRVAVSRISPRTRGPTTSH